MTHNQEANVFASCLKECSESLERIFCFFDPTTLWHKTICSSMGSNVAILKNLPAVV